MTLVSRRVAPERRLGLPEGVEREPGEEIAWPLCCRRALGIAFETGGIPMGLVDTTISNDIGTIILNNPKKLNALSKALMDDLCAALADMKRQEIRVVILRTVPGAKVFSAGHDVRELPLGGRDPLTYDDPLRTAIRKIEHFPAPVIAMVEGSVWGGACELVLSCDIIIVGEDTTFAITPAKLGVPYNISGVQNLLNTGGLPICKEMLFTAQPFPVSRLVDAEMVNRVVPRDQLEGLAQTLAEQIAANSPLVIRVLKEELRLLSASHNISPETFERVQSMRRQVYDSHDYQEGIQAFFERRPPVFRGK
jgi:methylmalonyl-CoA decarboxylase